MVHTGIEHCTCDAKVVGLNPATANALCPYSPNHPDYHKMQQLQAGWENRQRQSIAWRNHPKVFIGTRILVLGPAPMWLSGSVVRLPIGEPGFKPRQMPHSSPPQIREFLPIAALWIAKMARWLELGKVLYKRGKCSIGWYTLSCWCSCSGWMPKWCYVILMIHQYRQIWTRRK